MISFKLRKSKKSTTKRDKWGLLSPSCLYGPNSGRNNNSIVLTLENGMCVYFRPHFGQYNILVRAMMNFVRFLLINPAASFWASTGISF